MSPAGRPRSAIRHSPVDRPRRCRWGSCAAAIRRACSRTSGASSPTCRGPMRRRCTTSPWRTNWPTRSAPNTTGSSAIRPMELYFQGARDPMNPTGQPRLVKRLPPSDADLAETEFEIRPKVWSAFDRGPTIHLYWEDTREDVAELLGPAFERALDRERADPLYPGSGRAYAERRAAQYLRQRDGRGRPAGSVRAERAGSSGFTPSKAFAPACDGSGQLREQRRGWHHAGIVPRERIRGDEVALEHDLEGMWRLGLPLEVCERR